MVQRSPLSLIALAALASGCAARHNVFIAPAFREAPPDRVAVLLFENEGVDLNAPEMLRQLAFARLHARGYNALPLAEAADKLRGMGITDGGQLRSAKPQDVGQALGVDGLLYGDIETFSNTDLGYVMRKLVKVRLTLVDARSGDKLWEDEEDAQKVAVRTDTKEAERAAAVSLGERAVSNMMKKPLYEQSVQVMDKLFAALPPAGPSRGPKGPLLTPPTQPPSPPPAPR